MKLFKQYDVDDGKLGGTLKVFLETQFVLSVISFIGITRLLYKTDFYDKLPMWLFYLLIGLGYFTLAYLYFSIILPSSYKFSNRQMATHDNPMMDKLNEIKEEIEKIKTQIDNIERR